MNSLIVMAGGAIGALARYHLGRATGSLLGTAFPWGTLAANVAGGFAMGLLAGWLARHSVADGEHVRLALGVGVLGGFTTFSAFSLETVLMIEKGAWTMAGLYVLASVAGAVLALIAGLGLMRAVA